MAAQAHAPWTAATEDEKEQIRQQLQLLLASHVFRNSQRYPALLRYVVEQTLAGSDEQLKERTLGVAVFHRAPDYDTNADPVVRITAGEVRKRLAQYYQEHPSELRIDLPPGSYVPYFHPIELAVEPSAESTVEPTADPLYSAEAMPVEASSNMSAAVVAKIDDGKQVSRLLAGGIACFLLVAGVLSALLLAFHLHPQDELRSLWSPLLASKQQPAFVIGGRSAVYLLADGTPIQLAKTQRAEQFIFDPSERVNTVSVGDVVSFARLASLLSERGMAYSAAGAAQTTFEDLRVHPSILFGGFNNTWTLYATAKLRYRLRSDQPPGKARIVWVEDRRNPAFLQWSDNCQQPLVDQSKDYAVVARYFDPELEQQVVLAAGLGENGTTAASEFLTSNRYLAQLDHFPSAVGWRRKNVEAVLETEVVGGRSGPPRVVAAYVW